MGLSFVAETEKEAKEVLTHLTTKKLIVGGTMLNGPSHYWWKGEEIDMDNYYFVMGFTVGTNRVRLEKEYKNISKEEIPMIFCIKIEGNKEFLKFIRENTK